MNDKKKYTFIEINDFIYSYHAEGLKAIVENREDNKYILNRVAANNGHLTNNNLINTMIDLTENELINDTIISLFDIIDNNIKCESGYNILTYMIAKHKTELAVKYVEYLISQGVKYNEYNGSELYENKISETPTDFLLMLLCYYQNPRLGYFIFNMDDDLNIEDLKKYTLSIFKGLTLLNGDKEVKNCINIFYDDIHSSLSQGGEVKSNLIQFFLVCEDKIKSMDINFAEDVDYFDGLFVFFEKKSLENESKKFFSSTIKSVKL